MALKRNMLEPFGRYERLKQKVFAEFLEKYSLTCGTIETESAKAYGGGKNRVSTSCARAIENGTGGHTKTLPVLMTMYYLRPEFFFHADSPDFGSSPVPAPAGISRKWFGWHVSRENGETQLIPTKVEIHSNGECSLNHPRGETEYFGKIMYADKNSIYLCFSIASDDDPIIWNLNTPKSAKVLSGFWTGHDLDGHPGTGPVVLTTEEIKDAPVAARLLRECESMLLRPPECNSLHNKFSSRSIWKQARTLARDDNTILIYTTFIPDWSTFSAEFKKAARANPEIKWRVILLDPEIDGLMNARFLLHPDYDPETAKLQILLQIKQFKALKANLQRELQEKFNQEGGSKKFKFDMIVRLSRIWYAGMGVRVGQQALYLGLMFASESAVNSTMLEILDKESTAWQHFQQDWDLIWGSDAAPSEYCRNAE